MTNKNINGVVSIISVQEFDQALNFYTRLFMREPDLIPMEGVAEWQILQEAWVQLAFDSERAGSATVVITVNDIEEQHRLCTSHSLPIGDITEYPDVIKMAELIDPEGNKISFVQDISR
ncbi:VOC family protein [Neptunomonas marina]|uniref:VOC family protein n=1 Tax=Neptunomonas marina TaxID=1815562 RepID=A0A437QDU5_9GAMM|nr:VOC family protein [Neptunomonas marina]RVU32730.1 VOC family protein [Neptunomonas marina]